MLKYYIDKNIVLYKDSFAYSSHPSITLLDNREWLVVFGNSRRRETIMHPPSDPMFRNLLTRSSDQGATWEEPYFVPDLDWNGVECPGVSQLSNGNVVLTQFRFGWFPLGLAKKKKENNEIIYIFLPDVGWTENFTKRDWDKSIYSWARGYHGLYVHLSFDRGHTFEETVKIDCSPYRDGYTRTGVLELEDGRVIYSVNEHHPPLPKGDTYMLISRNGGKNWDQPVLAVHSPNVLFSEPDIAEIKQGEIFCILRSEKEGYMYGCRSQDGGLTWSSPIETSIPCYGTPGHLLVLKDGRLLCTYNRRVKPFGIRACVSEDGGRTWIMEEEIIIRDDFPNGDLGYPTTIEYENGKLFICYYGQEKDGVTSIHGTYVTLE
jgi:hypothetical protein